MTVRDSAGTVIQFLYGEDGLDPTMASLLGKSNTRPPRPHLCTGLKLSWDWNQTYARPHLTSSPSLLLPLPVSLFFSSFSSLTLSLYLSSFFSPLSSLTLPLHLFLSLTFSMSLHPPLSRSMNRWQAQSNAVPRQESSGCFTQILHARRYVLTLYTIL